MKKNRLLYILSGNLSTTPRALKSILYAGVENCDVLLVSRTRNWFLKDAEIIKEHNLNVESISLGKKPLFYWLLSTFIYKLFRIIYPMFRNSVLLNGFSSDKASILLTWRLMNYRRKSYSNIIGHGYGTLYSGWQFSKVTNTPFVFDMEDYHPGEKVRKDAVNESRRREFLVNKLLPRTKHVFFASPLISEFTLRNLPGKINSSVILNSFPADEFILPKENTELLQMVWFSQKISFGRGLELLFEGLNQVKDQNWNLTLIGELDQDFSDLISSQIREKINFNQVMPQKELHLKLAEYDVGLALEVSTDELNRDLCLTNKIFAYAQAGLYILATDTSSQKEFIQKYPDFGMVCEQVPISIANEIQKLVKRMSEIRELSKLRYENARGLSWDIEKVKLGLAFNKT